MSSPIHSKVLSRLSLLVPSVVLMCASLTVRADLEVEWIDSNTIRVYGYGSGGGQTVVTNWLGCCTNCTLITPEELDSGMNRIKERCDDADYYLSEVALQIIDLSSQVVYWRDDILTFQRFGPSPLSGMTAGDIAAFSNYVFSVDNIQTQLDLNNQPSTFATISVSRWASYNNGIYDYANNFVLDRLSQDVLPALGQMTDNAEAARTQLTYIKSIADEFIGLSSCPCDSGGGGGGGDSSGGCAWTQDQVDALFDYVDHIDKDQHKRFGQLNAISNNVYNIDKRMDSYAKLLSGVLYQDGTVKFGDGESWTNVYFSGESENYHYDKSNILQRIELILFGMAHSTTNFTLDASSVTNQLDDTASNNVTNQFAEFSSDSTNIFLNAREKLEAKVNSIKSISSMFVFWGTAGSDSPFTLGYVPALDGSGGGQYIEVGNGFLSSEVSRFRRLCRYGFQLIWATSFLFLIWLFYVRLFKYVVVFFKYAFEWINEAFAS